MWFAKVMPLLLLVSCSAPVSYRYELVVEVDTPQGPRTGSGVIEVTVRPEPKPLPDMTGRDVRIRGEAVAIDLPGGQTLFATLNGENSGGYAGSIAVQSLAPGSRTPEEAEAGLSVPGQEAPVPRQSYPLLVRFRDIRDPRTVEGVDPDNLSAAFGPAVRLKSIRIRTTRAEPTFVLQGRLPWLGSNFQVYPRASNGVEIGTSSLSFQRR